TGLPLSPKLTHQGRILTVAFSHDGLRVLTGSADRTAQQWDPITAARIGPALLHEDEVLSVAFNQSGSEILTGSGTNEKVARRWDARTGKQLDQPYSHPSGVPLVAFCPTEKTFATRSFDNSVRFWSIASGKVIHEFVHDRPVTTFAFSADGKRIVTSSAD